MPINNELKKVLVIGSGPIVIGQAAEFDYAGTQACKAIKEEGIEVVLVNSNPATIMTDIDMADRIYIEPLTMDVVSKIIEKERPDGIIPGLGGQTGLNLAVELSEAGILEKFQVAVLGTPILAIKKAEDREEFKKTMISIGEPIAESAIITKLDDALTFINEVGYPVIIRPAYTLGGTGGGIAKNDEELAELVNLGLKISMINQVLLEKSVAGWKEIELEVMRDSNDNCIAVCSMENFDPVGVHTGDSIVFAPTQTLSNKEYQMLRTAALKIIRALEVEGGCNIQFALDYQSNDYVVIEVNPRVSRSSALASKATGYPIARVAAKIALGYTLDEISNSVTGATTACFEPSIDYVVAKIPRWPFDKFAGADRKLGTQMKATGEVMAIGRTLEEALLKAVRSLESGVLSFSIKTAGSWTDIDLENKIMFPDDERLFAVAEAFRRAWTMTEIRQLTMIDPFFLEKIKNIVNCEKALSQNGLTEDTLRMAKRMGFCDLHIGKLLNLSEEFIRSQRIKMGILPVFKIVDTCAAEFEAATPYYYSTYEEENEVIVNEKSKVIVLGSGPIRIGQGIEFDYCSVHCLWALKKAGIEAIMINNNPETVSTDFDTGDKLYFEPLSVENILDIVEMEKPLGVIVQFGGQTAINLARPLAAHGVRILGTSTDGIDLAEDRKRCEKILNEYEIPQTKGITVSGVQEAAARAEELGFPLIVRPSYVLGGRAMEIIHTMPQLLGYTGWSAASEQGHPILMDKYLPGTELEVDAVSDGENVLIAGIMEHIERAGVHSGDSMAVYPASTLSAAVKNRIIAYTERIGKALKIVGLFNIQFVLYEQQVYVLEVNPRASRTVPILSKVTGLKLVEVGTRLMLGETLSGLKLPKGLWKEPDFFTVKSPVFSFEKLSRVDTSLGPEMKSTGEVMGCDYMLGKALYKVLVAVYGKIPLKGNLFVSLSDIDKTQALPLIKGFVAAGYQILATGETHNFLIKEGIHVEGVELGKNIANLRELFRQGRIQLVLNTPTKGSSAERTGFKIRRAAVENRIPSLTSLDTAKAFYDALIFFKKHKHIEPRALQDLQAFRGTKKHMVI